MQNLIFPLFLGFLAACGAASDESNLHESTTALKIETASDPASRLMKAIISTKDNDLSKHTNITKYIGRSVSSLKDKIGAEELLTDFSRSRAFTKPRQEVANCWYTAIASLMPSFTEERYMDDAEFKCLLDKGFKKTSAPQFGDVIRFQDDKGEEVHGATFIGENQDGKIIAFTKNGPTKETPWSFMTIDMLKKVYDETASVAYYTPSKKMSDPKSAADDCFAEAEKSRRESREMSGMGSGGTGPLSDWDM